MVKVLILGATGTLGSALAQALRRSNNTVYGVARSAEKARGLAADEIIPVECADPINDGNAWTEAVRKHRIDVVVDTTTANEGSLKIIEAVKALGKERLESAMKEEVCTPQKLGFLYTSGVWVHGNSMAQVSDLMPVGVASAPTPPVDLVQARPGWEQAVLKSRDVLDVAIIRPSMVYGRSSWIFGPVWGPIYGAGGAASVQVPVVEEAVPGLVHVDDVALGMQSAIEKMALLSNVYPVFDLCTSQESLAELARTAAKSLGHNGKVEMAGPGDNPFFKAINTSVNVDSSRAKQLLGWEPKKLGGLLPNIDTYVMAWKASQQANA